MNFLHILWLLIFNLLPLWPKTIICMISILLNFLSHVLWSNVLSTLENVPLEKNVYSAVWEKVFYRCLFIMLFKASVFLLIFCLFLLSIIDRSVLMSPPIIVQFSISPFNSILSYFMYFDAFLGTCIFIIVMSWEIDPLHYKMSFSVSSNNSCHEICLSDINIASLSFVWLMLAWYIFSVLLLSTYLCP